MSNRGRISDPTNTVSTHLARVHGVLTQAETDREMRRQAKYGDGQSRLGKVIENVLFKGRTVFQRNSDESIRINNDTGDTQFLFGTQGGINPVFLIGNDIIDSVTGYTIKYFGLRGDQYLNGLLSSANVDISKWYCGCHHSPNGTTLETYGMPAWTVDGAIISDDSGSNSWARFTTAAVIGDDKGANGDLRYRTDQGFELMFRVATGSDISSQRVWVGVFASDPAGTNTPLQNFIGFRYVGGTDTNWICYTGDGAARTNTDSGVAVTANTSYYLRLRVTATEAQHSLGMPNVGAGTTNFSTATTLPAVAAYMAPYVRITALAASARSFLFGTFNGLGR